MKNNGTQQDSDCLVVPDRGDQNSCVNRKWGTERVNLFKKFGADFLC
jgi:hypothetical protein